MSLYIDDLVSLSDHIRCNQTSIQSPTADCSLQNRSSADCSLYNRSSSDCSLYNRSSAVMMEQSVTVQRARLDSMKAQNSDRACRTFKRGESHTAITMNSYMPTIITEQRRKIEDLCRDLVVNNDHIHCVEQRMRVAIEQGLSATNNQLASVKCFPTYVRYLPSGEEVGKFLALDLGGTNFRVLVIDIEDGKKFQMDSKVFAIAKEIMEGAGDQLFDHIAKCLAEFVQEKGLDTSTLPLGFTFSFPCKQEGLAVGILTTWTKGFKCSGVEGKDVVELLKQALKRRGDVNIEVRGCTFIM